MTDIQTQFADSDALFETVATIFAVTVLLDKRTRDRELVEFAHACMVHNHALRPKTILPRRKLIAWFHENRDAISARIEADTDGLYKHGLLSRIHTKELQRRVLSSIFTISVADYELHDEESDFINSALRVWKTEMPTPDEIDMVA